MYLNFKVYIQQNICINNHRCQLILYMCLHVNIFIGIGPRQFPSIDRFISDTFIKVNNRT